MRWLYRFLRPIVRFALRIYFRKIYLHFADEIPSHGPVMISANHPSAFLEAILMACYLKRPIHFLVRGDVFANSFVAKLLELTHQIPIYRFRDGFSSMRRNHDTFSKVYELLNEDKVVVIFSESFTVLEKRLRPIQKGTARLAFGAYEHVHKEFPIIPVGVNYTQADRFRSEVSIIGGKSIDFMPYYQVYKQDKQKGLNGLTEQIRTSLDELVIQVKDPSDDDLSEKLFEHNRPLSFYELSPTINRSRAHFDADRQTAEWINLASTEQKQALADKLSSTPDTNPLLFFPLKLIYVIGYLVNYPPVGLIDYIQRRYIKSRPFKGPIMVGGGTILYAIYVLMMVCIFLIIGFAFVIPLVGLPLLGYVSLMIKDYINLFRIKTNIVNNLIPSVDKIG